MFLPEHFKHNIFSLPVKSPLALREGAEYLEYAPELGVAFLCTAKDVERIERDLAGGDSVRLSGCFQDGGNVSRIKLPQSPDDFYKLTVIPTLSCNFSCSYCYAAHGRSSMIISDHIIKSGLDYFLRPGRERRHLKIMITGGGEPLTAWDKVKYLLDYARQLADANGYSLYCTIMTNGALLNAEKIQFLKSRGVHICVSFDITRSAQEKTRKHYDEVSSAISLGLELGAEMFISATVTPDTVDDLPEMFRLVQEKYSGVKGFSIEPVTLNDGFSSVSEAEAFYSQFLESFCRYLDSNPSRDITCSPLDFMDRRISRCCPGKLCLTPQGDFSICHCVSSPNEQRFNESIYGSIDKTGGIKFDLQKFTMLMNRGKNIEERCRNCFAKYNCGGMCLTRESCYSPEIQNVYCEFLREFIRRELESRCLRRGKTCCLF